jgi:mono/diheme cytochrome c family protein
MRSVVLAVALAIVALGAGPASADPDEVLSSIVRGGRLYDNWYRELGEPAPKKSHPAYPKDMRYAGVAKANWRCKECHGWDYRGRDGAYAKGPHFTGIVGIQGMAGAENAAIIARLKDKTHAYGGLLGAGDFTDLANFVSQGQLDMDRYIDRASGLAKGDRTRREAYFATICANCHGKDGQKFRTMGPLGKVAKTNPYEALHKILNGHPGESMPALRAFDTGLLVEILAYVQTLPAEELLSSIVRGGRLYDNWYKETSQRPPAVPHPAYPAGRPYARDGAINWRCVSCHGWDYMGRDGAYGTGPYFTGIKGIRAAAGADPGRIEALLGDVTHGYVDRLGARDLQDLANFVTKGQVDMSRMVDRASGMAKGEGAAGEAYFNTICATCHGRDGRKVMTMRPLGKVAKSNPWNALHKILNGHPNEKMPALRVLDMEVLVDILAHAQTLPTAK